MSVVFVAGGNSNTGSATIQSLLKTHPTVTIRAGVRDSKKANDKFGADAKRITFVEHDVKDGKLTKDGKSDATELKGVDTLVLVPPQVYQDRVGVVSAYVAAAKAAGVKHIVFMSTPIAKSDKLILGKELHANEKLLKESGIPTTYLHLVMFYENHWGNKDTVSGHGAFYYPAKANVPIQGIAVSDIGEAAANVIAGGASKHGNKTYFLGGPALTWDQVAGVYSKVLNKAVKFVSVTDEAATKSMTGMGFPEVMAKGLVELHRWLEAGLPENQSDLTALLDGQRKPTTFEQWLSPVAVAFGQVQPPTVFVAGGNSNTGSATISALLKYHPTITVRAGVRDSKKAADKFGADAKRITFVVHDVKDGQLTAAAKTPEDNAAELKGVDTLVLVPPQGYQDRVGVANAYIAAAKAAGVKHIVFVSTPIAKEEKMILGKDLFLNEAALKASGIPTTYLHLVMFYENHWGNKETLSSHGAFYYPAKGDVPVQGIAVADIGEAAANVIAGGASKYGDKTFFMGGPALTWNQVAAVFSRGLAKPVKYVQVPDEAAIKAMTGMGFPDVMAKGLVELHHWLEAGIPENTSDLSSLLNGGRAPTTLAEWFAPISGAFGPVNRTIFVAGATGNTGSHTVNALLKHYPSVTVRAGVRDAKKAESKFPKSDSKRISFITGDVNKDGKFTGPADALTGVDSLILPMPQAFQDRIGYLNGYLAAAKAAGVKHIVWLSAAVKEPMLLAKDFIAIEAAFKASAIPVTVLQLAFFYENNYGNAATIKSQGAFYYPAKANVPVQALASADIGEAAASAAIGGAALHGNRVYWLGGPALTWDQVAAVFAKALNKSVKFVSVSDEAAIKSMTGAGYPEVIAKGLVELHKVLDTGVPTSEADLTALLGRKPTTLEQWLAPVTAAFK